VVVAALFFTVVDYVIAMGVRGLFGFGRSL
jgi:hypothetical protein